MSESRKNINEIVAALQRLRNSNGNFKTDDKALFDESRLVFEKLKRLSDFDPDDIGKVIDFLDKLPPEIKELDIGEIDIEAKEMESRSLDKEDLKQLVEDYEKAQNGDRKEALHEEIYKRTGKRNVDQFIKSQKEIAAKNKEKLDKLSPEIKEKVTQDLAKISDEDHEKVANILEKATLEEKFNKKELEKEIRKVYKEKEEAERVLKKVEEIRAEIKVESKAEEIANKTYEKLKTENIPISGAVKAELKEAILESWKVGDKVEIPEQLTGKEQGEVIVREAVKASEIFKAENLETVVNYRATELEKEIGQQLRNNGIRDENLIADFVDVTNKLTNNFETTREETNRSEITDFVQSSNEKMGAGEIERSVDEAQFMAKNVIMAPKKFNKLIGKYNELREKIGTEKLPKLKEVRVLNKMSNIFENSPQMLRLMNGAQRMVGFLEKVNNFPGNLLTKIGVQNVGLKVLGKIGGQAAVEFVKQASLVIAKEGTLQGIKSIALGIMGKGAVTAGGAAAGGGALAGAVAAFQALPVVGQVIAVVVGAVILLKGVFDGVKGVLGKITGLDMNGVKNFITDTLGLGKVAGGVGQFIADTVTFLVGIPALLGLISFTAIVTPVVIFFFLGVFTYSLLQQNLVSSIVPPSDMGNCVLKSEYSGAINCDQNAPENSIAGVDKANFIDVANRWQSGSNFANVCFNDTVNRALCAGINPTYALWVWLHESGASNYAADDIEDFGIHDSTTPDNNYNAQITKFLTLTEVGKRCLSDPRIKGDFWLSWATSYLNGYDCNPDKPNPTFPDMTPRKYAAEFREQWTWISSSPIPNSILIAKAGKNCDQIGKESTNYAGNAHEHTDPEGNVWICTENSQAVAGGNNYDPNSPGLSGVAVDGECSVGDVVVPTKQCDSQWGNTLLNGGSCANGKPGTICSAGCGPTSVSMLMRHVNGSMTPNNVIFGSGSAYANMGCEGSSFDQAQTELTKKFGAGAVTYDAITQGCDEKAIAKWICDGKVVMVLANFYRNSKLELGGHYVLAIGVKNGKIVVADPFYDTTTTPFDGTNAYGYAHDIKGCLLVDKAAVK